MNKRLSVKMRFKKLLKLRQRSDILGEFVHSLGAKAVKARPLFVLTLNSIWFCELRRLREDKGIRSSEWKEEPDHVGIRK